ncbi:NADH dehydrogenase subunit L [Tenacibaculum sp. KUL152]|nr:NADH dehydrogenase subunit L [Tenacibaculum sp. KUL152]
MSSQTSSFLLVLLPLFWTLMSWFSGPRNTFFSKLYIERIAIWGSIILFAISLVVGFIENNTASVSSMLVTLSPLKSAVILTVVAIGVILMRFSRNYFVGEACYPRFLKWMQLTLASVVITILANHLIVFWFGWLAVSLSLHNLLLLYPDRPRAIVAAHKKFILARTSELFMAGAFALLYLAFDTLYINQIVNALVQTSLINSDALSSTQQEYTELAACCIAIAALIKCAQLPAHGWLINIVEAPTPVSALLHAGVINLGGYLLLAFAPLIALHASAQWILAVGAGLSVLFSALAMTTRVTVKVRLAWSTSSQMGLMLVECALGLYSLALIHLVAHSFYKAYAFLNSGSAVFEALEDDISAHRTPQFADWLNALFVTSLIVLASFSFAEYQGPLSPWLLITLAFTAYIATRTANSDQTQLYVLVGISIVLISLYSTLKDMVTRYLFAHFPAPASMLSTIDIWVVSLIAALFVIHIAMQTFAHKPAVQQFKQLLFAGLYLDEWFTKITLKVSPISLRKRSTTKQTSASVTHIGGK